jgi:DNA-binding SARP family transcriptional activator
VEVEVDGRPLDLGAPKQRALLALLLSRADHVVSVDTLVEELWAGEPPAAATGSLQAYVSNLRRLLEPRRASRAPATVLVTRAPGYVLRTEAAAFDVREFATLTERAREALAGGRADAAVVDLDAALALWQGDAYADVSDARWVQAEVARLDELRLAAVEDRAEALLESGRHPLVVADLDAHVTAHPLRERARRLLALALYRSGRQADALSALRTAREHLADELGVDPGPDLRDLEVAILRQDPELSRDARRTPSPRALAPVVDPPGRDARPAAPFVGRAEALRVLADAMATATATRVVLVDGDPGIGKTRLVEAFAGAVDVPALWGRSPEHEVAPPLWPWEQVLAALARTRPDLEPPAEVRMLLDHREQEPAFDAAGARLRLYEAIGTHLRAAAPVVVVLDDLHWADTASLRLLVHLAMTPAPAGVHVLATYRRHEAAGLGEALAGSATAVLGAVNGHLGEAALALGDVDVARDLLTDAVGTLDRAGSPYWSTRARLALAKCSPNGAREARLVNLTRKDTP